ncbi:hypothetical protein HB364_22250 [Pseudoflavitalea sp. X16]|uniref:hypothetical protein n=1 Tax=Paraflavitalea devenefica TaxID=2716334 RepID=UPI001423F689|nr:hypothetical protein [Paraflavitalea devenefica]NII27821.1 hypothetical protein [Paraflavitalea devenefica]
MKKIKNIRHLKAEQQKLLQKRIRLEEKMEHQWQALKSSNKVLVNTVSWGFSLLSGRWWAKAGKKWFDLLK